MHPKTTIPLRTQSNQAWCTPRWLFDAIQAHLGVTFGIDVAANAENTLCTLYFNEACDGLAMPWCTGWNWCNPPYDNIAPWCARAHDAAIVHGASSALLLPARLETNWYKCAARYCRTIIITPRAAFEGGTGKSPPHGSMLLVFTPESIDNPSTADRLRVSLLELRKPKSKGR